MFLVCPFQFKVGRTVSFSTSGVFLTERSHIYFALSMRVYHQRWFLVWPGILKDFFVSYRLWWFWGESQSSPVWAIGRWSNVTVSGLSLSTEKNLNVKHVSCLHTEEGNRCSSMSQQDLSAKEDDTEKLFPPFALSDFQLIWDFRKREEIDIIQMSSFCISKLRIPILPATVLGPSIIVSKQIM